MACQGDPIECGWEAAVGQAEMRLEQALRIVRKHVTESNESVGISPHALVRHLERAGFSLPTEGSGV